MKDKQQSYFVNIGSSSLLVIFLVLCLVTFAILSISSARSDYSFSERMAAHKQSYYEASEMAETVVGEIDDILYETAGSIDQIGSSDAAGDGNVSEMFLRYYTDVSAALDGAQISGITVQAGKSEETYIISFQVPAGERQALQVRLQVTDYREHENYYEIKTWKIINVDSWEGEQPLNLMPVVQ